MLTKIPEKVDQRVAYRPRRGERPRMVPVFPDLPMASQHAIHRAGEPNGEAAKPSRERSPVFGLRDEMNVVVLDAVFDDAELGTRRFGDRLAHSGECPRRAETVEGGHGT